MKTRDPLAGLKAIWDRIDSLEQKIIDTRSQVEDEIRRLSRNKHRQKALRQLYWDPRERVPVMVLAELFRLDGAELIAVVRPLGVAAVCNLCGLKFTLEVKTRSARIELERERVSKTLNPKQAVCSSCFAFRQVDLEILRKKKGERLDGLHLAAYQKYLLTPQWAERRARALKRAKGKCSLCSSKKRLECHHRTYERIGMERDEDLSVLCANCHGSHHY